MIQESNLLVCLKSAMIDNLSPQARQRKVLKLPEWKMLEKPWKSLLLSGLYELHIPNEDDNTNQPQMMRARSTSRSRRGVSQNTGPLQWLPETEEVIIAGAETEAFRLAVLQIRKSLFSDDWDEGNDQLIEQLRESCASSGVHEVWHKMAECTPILAQFMSFPKLANEDAISDEVDSKVAFIDPMNSASLAKTLETFEKGINNAPLKIAVQRAKNQLSSKKGLRDFEDLESLDGELSVISALLNMHMGNDASENLKELKKSNSKLSEALNDLLKLRSGESKSWNKSRKLSGKDELTLARKTAAWNLLPADAEKLSSKELDAGLTYITDSKNKEKLTWWKLSALVKEGESEMALSLLDTLSIESDADISALISMVKQLGDGAGKWLEGQLDSLSLDSLLEIIEDDDFSHGLKYVVAKRIHESGGQVSADQLIDVFTENLDLQRLSEILLGNEERCADHPYSTLLVAHLLPANFKGGDFQAVRKARRDALSTVEDAEAPDSISDASRGLILLLDGAAQSDDNWLISTLDKNGIKAFNNCRQALKDGGDGLADSKVIDILASSLDEGKLSNLESRLFGAVIDTLRLNRASWLLQTGYKKDNVVKLLDGLLSSSETALPMMQAVKHLVLEYDIGVPNLVKWYQENDPQSPWHTLARAARHLSNKEELNAARDYKRAGDHKDFDYEHKILLYRKALIHYAHSEQWNEAVDLLEKEPALKTALTKRFQLYLKVSKIATTGKSTDDATKMLKSFVRKTVLVEEEDQFGKINQVEKSKFSEEELDILRNYAQSRSLPAEPFTGRVKAALNSIQRDRRRVNRYSYENRYANVMIHEPSTEEIYNIASEASAQRPLDGLMLLERAQSSPKLSLMDRKRLAQAEQGLFATHRNNLPVKQRTYLKHLKLSPLIIIDTNILMDELQYRVSNLLGISSEVSLDVGGRGRFHRILKHRADEKRVHLWIPKVVSKELVGLAQDVQNMKSRFSETLVDKNKLDEIITKDELESMANQVVKDFSTWKPLDLHIEDEANDEEIREELKQFLLDHSEVYDEITAMKRQHGEPARSVIANRDIYPETPDQSIMCIAAAMADQPLDEIGSILVATRDSDFTLVARAVEERFGFGVIANSRDINN